VATPLNDYKWRELGASGLRAYPNIARKWGLTESEAAGLLGISLSTYQYWMRYPERANLDVSHLERLSLVLGIYKYLHTLLPCEETADSWIRRVNANPLFEHRAPLDRLLSGQVADLRAVNQHLKMQFT
jgi:hypothetical protein